MVRGDQHIWMVAAPEGNLILKPIQYSFQSRPHHITTITGRFWVNNLHYIYDFKEDENMWFLKIHCEENDWTILQLLCLKQRAQRLAFAIVILCYFRYRENVYLIMVFGLMKSIWKSVSPSSSKFYLLAEIKENIDSVLRALRHSQSLLSFWLNTISLLWWPQHPRPP